MQIQIPYNEVTPLIKIDYSRVYDDLGRTLSPQEMIFAPRRAGFGGILQWDLPAGLHWVSATRANSFDRNDAFALYNRLRQSATPKLGTHTEFINSIYSVPSADYLYCARDSQGAIHIMLVGWGYRFPRIPAVDPLSWHAEGEQHVTLRFIENGHGVSTTMRLQHASSYTKDIASDADGNIDFGSHAPGSQFQFTIPERNRQLTFTVEKGRDTYVFDLTPAVVQPPTPAPAPMPQPSEIAVAPEVSVRFIGENGSPITNSEARLMQGNATIIASGTDHAGMIRLASTDIPANTQLSFRLNGHSAPSAIVPFVFDPTELEYEVRFHRVKKDSSLSLVLGIIAAVALAAVAFLALASFDVMQLDLF